MADETTRSPRAAHAHDDSKAAAKTIETPAPQGGVEEEHTEENQYGLQDLDKLPLLEQVHRLFHTIQMKYPYKETAAWKSLPVDQKKRMLEYIRDKRVRKAAAKAKAPAAPVKDQQQSSKSVSLSATAAAASPLPVVVKTDANAALGSTDAPKPTVKTDPYLQMLQRRSITTMATSTAPTGSSATALLLNETLGGSHPNSAYIAPAQVAQYTERKTRTARWKVVDAEFYDEKCSACGIVHKEFDGAKGALLNTIGAMMSTFGDFGRPCALAVQGVKDLVGEHLHTMLGQVDPEELSAGPGLRTLVEVFHEEAAYYGRWREFRGESKHEQNELEDVEEEELAEELDLFAVSEADSVFNEAFLERIKFADERTKAMDWSIYDMFAKGRKLNFMSSKGQQFRHWLRVGKCSRASLEFMNFVAYHNIGRLVELAIKHRQGGVLQAMESPLIKSDIQAVATAFLPAADLIKRRTENANDEEDAEGDSQPAVKVRRVSTKDGDITVTERVAVPSSAVAAAPSSSFAAEAGVPVASMSPERAPPQGTTSSSGSTPNSATKARPTRLKRLR